MKSDPQKKPLYLFHGEDTYSSSKKVAFWKSEFIKKYSDSDLVELNGKKMNLPGFETDIQSMPFLSEKRLFIIHDFFAKAKDDERDKMLQIVEKIPDHAILIFYESKNADKRTSLYKKLNKIGTCEQFDKKSPQEIASIIKKREQKNTNPMGIMEINLFIERIGTDLWKMENEHQKLHTYANGKKITKEMIEQLTPPSLTNSIFNLTDAISQKNPLKAIKILQNLLEHGERPEMILFMIVRHFRILIQVKDLIEKNIQASDKLKEHPFTIKNAITQSKNFTKETLKEIYQRLLYIDSARKSSLIQKHGGKENELIIAIEQLFLKST